MKTKIINKTSASILTILALIIFGATKLNAAPGNLDLTFSGDGKLTDWVGAARGIALQPDGKIVVVGGDASNSAFAVARYNSDGSPDTGFGGGDGKVTTDIGFSYEGANAVALQSDGKIVAVGTTWDGSGSQWGHFSLVRYNPDGSLDLTFGGGDGIVVTENLGTGWVAANSVAIQADGKIVAAGRMDYYFYDFPELVVIRYNPDGSLDLPFGGGGGKARIPWGPGPFGGNAPQVEDATSVAIQPDGKIVAAGYSYGFWDFSALVRFDSNGSLDQTFGGGDGIVHTDIGPGADVAHSAAIQSDGKIVTAGYSYNGSNNDFALVRYNSNGSLDTTFDSDGKVITPIGSGISNARAVAVQSNGKIVAAGTSDNGSNIDFALVRYNPNGSLDATFGGGDGITTADFDISNDNANGMALDNAGRAVVVGESGGMFAIARFLGDPTPTPTPTATATPTPTVTPTPLPSPTPTRGNGKIAFTSDRDGNREIYVMNPDGTGQVRLTNNNIIDHHPAWSPDGTKIAFLSQRGSGAFAIFVMNPNGTGKTEITPVNYQPQPQSLFDGFSLGWSPDGGQLVFSEYAPVAGTLFIVNADGSNRRNLTSGIHPAWSPDGSKILFLTIPGGSGFNINTIRPDGTDLRNITPSLPNFFTVSGSPPVWSPDGSKIAFSSFDAANSVVNIANADGTNPQDFVSECATLATPNGCSSTSFPVWSPNGRTIAFINFGLQTNAEIYVKNIGGQIVTRLTNTPGNNTNPDWQPLLLAACPNPIDCNEFFVQQHYLDFLNREPDPDGFAYWTDALNQCGTDAACLHQRRIGVSAAFFIELEFQETGSFVYRFYQASLGRRPAYTEFLPDRALVVGGPNLEANKQAFALNWVQRAEFVARYPLSQTAANFVDALLANVQQSSGVNLTALRDSLITEYNAQASQTASRARVVRLVADAQAFQSAEYNKAFVLMQYFGYLRRDTDQGGYDFWLNILNQQPQNFRGMVCAFLTATEYQQRFGAPTRSNADCVP